MRRPRSVVARIGDRTRRRAWLGYLRFAGWWAGATILAEIDPTARIGSVRVSAEPGTTTRVSVGRESIIDSGVLLRCKGGDLVVGPSCLVRRGTILSIAGRLEFVGDNMISWNNTIHCDEAVTLDRMSFTSEGCTISDGSHYVSAVGEKMLDNLKTSPVKIGVNTWLCPKSTVTRGVRIGSACIVAANSVVISDVPDGQMASGVPARIVAPSVKG